MLSDKTGKKRAGGADTSVPQPYNPPWQYLRASDVYNGGSDDEMITRGGGARANPYAIVEASKGESDLPVVNFEECKLQRGQLCEDRESFCSWQSVKTYPYVNIGNIHRQKVAEAFFDKGRVFERSWDFFYLYRSADANPKQTPFILVTTKQLEHFLKTINQSLMINLTVEAPEDSQFKVMFVDDGTSRPRYLGRTNSKIGFETLRNSCPASYFKPEGEENTFRAASQKSLEALKGKIDMMPLAAKSKKATAQVKKRDARMALQKEWQNSIKRAQRYLGLRLAGHEKQINAFRSSLMGAGLRSKDHEAAVQAAASKLAPSTEFDPNKPVIHEPEGSVVFVCIDIEANERNAKQITEIGIATLDTEDIKDMVPGKFGVNWLEAIRARHFRINEYKSVVNTEFVSGCADRFEFGTSEFIDEKDAAAAVASCFKAPFSKPDGLPADEDAPKRNIVLVGHDVGADITYLKQIGYDIYNLINLLEIQDTASMWRVLKRETNPRNLGQVLTELDITGWNLHNAGNDAAYTLQAMIRIAIKHLVDKQIAKQIRDKEIRERNAKSAKTVKIKEWEKEEGWSSGGENSDGGAPRTLRKAENHGSMLHLLCQLRPPTTPTMHGELQPVLAVL
ncbi:hypothetical protein BJ878DRAFT_320174 [Calycina marina]|uniref:Gfd2/YDR514C-like C-terminal domain-containing protein n=1 Tax=Calycina marina TaxID=1763456 RepID=A0A9P8CB16_9HELO|nr:hypothetical protein BJ878DRAFT_320174 [Calycina marina]